MSKIDNVTSYLMMITQIRDQLVVVGEKVLDAKFTIVAQIVSLCLVIHLSKGS